MTELNHEQDMRNIGCPDCGSPVEPYDTRPDGKGGKYKCPNCGRNTEWSVGTAIGIEDLMKEIQEKRNTV